MNKKVLSLVLALVIVLGTFGTVVAADEYSTQDQKIQWLIDNEIVIGRKVNADGSADLALNEYLTRAEVTKLIVYTLKLQNLADALKGVMQPFPDVDINHWANGYVSVATTQRADVANGRRIVIGYPDGKFYPNNNVTYAELATMLVRIVKKDLTDAMEKNAIWATSYMRWAEEEGILKGLTIADSNKPVPRRDAFEMIFNAMYALGDYEKGAVNFGDQLGIVSKFGFGEIQLNQDPEKVYKITANTMVTDGTSWLTLSQNLDRANLGSLVRVIVNDNKEVTHLLELGNPRDLAIGRDEATAGRNHRWFNVADNTAEGNATFKEDFINSDVITIQGITAAIKSDTRFFAADPRNNVLKEVTNLGDLFRLFKSNREIEKVYMGYNTYYGNNHEAKVIVFNEVEKYQGPSEVRRVTRFLNSARRFGAEDTKGVETIYDISNSPIFPGTDLVDYKDVVRVRLDAYNSDLRRGLVYIDYSEDSVFLVKELSNSNRKIVLEDKDGYVRDFYLPTSAKIFLEGQLKEGAHVQVYPYKLDQLTRELEIVSVVNELKLKGTMPESVRAGSDTGYVDKFDPDTREVTVVDKNGRNPRYYYVSANDEAFVQSQVRSGNELVFELSNMYHDGLRVVYAVELKEGSQDRDLRLAEAAVQKFKDNPTQANKEEAQKLVDRIIDSEKRADLQEEIDAVTVIEPLQALENALNRAPRLDEIEKAEDMDTVNAMREEIKELEDAYDRLSTSDKETTRAKTIKGYIDEKKVALDEREEEVEAADKFVADVKALPLISEYERDIKTKNQKADALAVIEALEADYEALEETLRDNRSDVTQQKGNLDQKKTAVNDLPF